MRQLRHNIVFKDLATIQEDLDQYSAIDQKPRFTVRRRRKMSTLSKEHVKEGRNDKQDNVHHIKDESNEAKFLLRGDHSQSSFSPSPYKLLPPIGEPLLVSRGISELMNLSALCSFLIPFDLL